MEIRFAPSAWRHGIDIARVVHVIENCPDPIYPASSVPGESDRVLFLGPDQRGIPLEVVAIDLPRGELLVIHAMRLRRSYRDDYMRVMSWHERS